MLYIYMLGYDVDFGHMEAVSLISAPKYPEKQVMSSFPFNAYNYLYQSCPLKISSLDGKNDRFYFFCILADIKVRDFLHLRLIIQSYQVKMVYEFLEAWKL